MENPQNKKLQSLHSNLKDIYDLPDYDTFAYNLEDPVKSKAFYETLKKDGYDMPPDYEAFVSDLGIKKKDIYETLGFGRDLVKEVFGEDYVKPSPEDEPEVSKKPSPSELANFSFTDTKDVVSKAFKTMPDAPADLSTPDLTLKKAELKGFPQNSIDTVLFDAVRTPVKEDPEVETSYLTALPKGFNERMAQAVRVVGNALSSPLESAAYITEKVTGKKGGVQEALLRQAFSALPILGGFKKENYEQLASAIENAGNPKAVPNDLIGKTLSATGSILFDVMTVRATPTLKLNALAKYGMERTPMFPAYLASMEGGEAARTGDPAGKVALKAAEGFASGLTYEGMGIAAGRIGQLVNEFGGGQTLSSASRALANSVMFGADSKLKGGTFAEGAAMGFVFGGYDLGMEAINRSIANRAYVSYLTATDNSIKTISQMKIDPVKLRKQSDDLWTQYEKETDPKAKNELLQEKTAVDNVLNINAMTQEIIKNPKAFIDNIKKDARLSEKEKKIWADKINTTVQNADPRLQESKPVQDNLKKLEDQLQYWKEDTQSDPNVKEAQLTAITEQIDAGKKELAGILSKPLEDYYKPEETKKPEEGKQEPKKTTEKLSLGDKTFSDKTELDKYLQEVAINKESGEVDERWFDREVNSWPNMETVKAINEWTENKKAEIKAKQEKAKPKTEVPEEPETTQKVQKELNKDDLIDEIRRYNILSASQKKKNALQANTIRVNAQRLGYELKEGMDEWKIGVTKDGKFLSLKKTPVKTDKAKIESQQLLSERDQEFQDYVNDVLETNPNLFGVMIGGLSNEQRAQAYNDIKAGKKSAASMQTLNELDRMYKEHGGIDIWNAEGQKKVSVSRNEIRAEVEDMKRKKRDELFNVYDLDEALEKGLITKTEYDEIRESERKQDLESRAAEEDFYRDETGDVESKKQEGGVDEGGKQKVETDEGQVQKPDVAKGTETGDQLQTGTSPTEGGTAEKGKAEPKYTAEQQSQIDAINKDYDSQIAEVQKSIDKMDDKARAKVQRDAEAKINKRNTIFGDAEAVKDGVLKPEDQGFEVTDKPVKDALLKFDEVKTELSKKITQLEKERQSKIGEVEKQTAMKFRDSSKGNVEGFPSTSRAKDAKKLGIEPKTDNVEELAWDQPLPMSVNEDPQYKSSDLNNAMSLRNMGRNLVKNIGKTEGEQVRTGMIKRFMRRAAGLFNPESGVIRVKNVSDVRVLSHELGHYIDQFVFDIRGVIGHRAKVEGDRFADVDAASKIQGVKFRNKTYKTEDAINAAVKNGTILQAKANELLNKLSVQLKARDARLKPLKDKYGDDIVAGVIQRQFFKQELTGYLAYIGYPSKKRTEAIAEFVKDYIINPAQAKTVAPKFHAWFEKLIENAPEVKTALDQARKDWNKYDAQDPRLKVLSLFSQPEEKTSFLDGIIKLDKNEILYSWVNHLQYMKNLAEEWKKVVGSKYSTSKDPYISAKTMMGIDGRAQQWLLNHPYERKGKDVKIKKDIEGLMSVLKPILGTDKDMDYRGYLLAKDSMESHLNGNPEQAAMPLELAQASIKLWEEQYGARNLMEFQAKVQKYNDALLDFYVESGKMSQESVDLIKKKHQYYVPLKRVFDEYEVGGGSNLSLKQSLSTSEKAVWSRHGSMKAIKDIYQSMIENTYHILAAGERNIQMGNIRDALFDIQKYNRANKVDRSIIEEIPPNTVKAFFDVAIGEMRYTVSKEKPRTGKIMSVWDKGEVHYYDVAPEYYDVLFQQEPKVTELFRRLSMPSRWLQAGAVVYDPTFPIRNIVRDQQSSWFYSKYGYMPTDFLKGLSSFMNKDEAFQKWMAAGGDQSFLVSADQMMEKDYAKKKIGRTLQRKWETYKKNPLAAFQDLSRASEIGTRVGAFKNAYKRTGDVWKAAVESRDIAADYGMHGARVRSVLGMYPFLNARAQHGRMMTETFKEPLSLFMKGMAITAPALANWFWNNQDEESRKLYQSLPAWRRVGMFNVRIPGTEHFLPLPKGFYGVLFGSSVESMMDHFMSDDDRVAQELPKELFQQFSPIGNATEFVPFIIRPQLEMWANKKGYTGKPIISESMKLLKPSEQFYNSTPEIYKKIGEALNWSPVKIDHYVKSYFGGAGMGAVNILDETLQMAGIVDKKPEDTFTALSRMPVFKALLTERPIGLQSGYIADFYETLDKIEKVNATFNNLVKTENYEKLNKFMQDPDNQRMYSFYEGNSTAINQFRSVLTWIRDAGYAVMKDDNLTNKQKQDEVRRLNDIVQESSMRFKDAYEKGEMFDYGKNMDEVILKMKEEKRDVRSDLNQQQNVYNPYWQSLKKNNALIFENIKNYGGFKELDQRVTITREGQPSINLDIEKSRIFNEMLVQNYAKQVKNMLGESLDKYIKESEKKPLDSRLTEKTRLQETFDNAWDMARTKTKNDFIQKKLYKDE